MRQLPPRVEMSRISRAFNGVQALDAVDFRIAGGEIHALLGGNGAGKSTLMNVLAGACQPDTGTILVDEVRTRIDSPAHATRLGIGMVHQHFKLVDAFTVAENVHLGWTRTPWRIRPRLLEAHTAFLADANGLAVRPDALLSDLSAGEQQRVEILRVLARGARVLVLDEPTAVLTDLEVASLFDTLRALRDRLSAVVLISHRLGEVLEIADRITVLRAGRIVACLDAREAGRAQLAQLIAGPELAGDDISRPDAPRPPAVPVLSLHGVTVRDRRGVTLLDGIDLAVHGAEILGIAGVAGNGQAALGEVLAGCLAPSSGSVTLDGAALRLPDPGRLAQAGIGHMPDDRLRTALAGDLPVQDNAALREHTTPPLARGPLFRPGAAKRLAQRLIETARISPASPSLLARSLSGGNQQRLVAARESRIATRVLIAAYPTRGLDVGAVAGLQAMLRRLRADGVGVVLISEETEELLALSDRIAVLHAGRIAAILPAASTSAAALGRLMSGEAA